MKKIFYLLALSFLFTAQIHSQQDSLYVCPHDTTDYYHGLTFITELEEASEIFNFHPDGVLWLTQPDGTASLTGNFIEPGNSGSGFTADINLTNGMGWEAWSDQGFPTSYLNDENLVTDEYLEWIYYIIDGTNSTLTGFGAYEGSQLQITHAPVSHFYAYQVGLGANQGNLEDGHGGWALVSGTFVNSETGFTNQEFTDGMDFYFTYGCEPVIESIESIASDSQQFSVYPNPVVDVLTLKTKGVQFTEGMSGYSIYDAMGRKVMSVPAGNRSFDVSELPAGSYVLLVDGGGFGERLRFLKG